MNGTEYPPFPSSSQVGVAHPQVFYETISRARAQLKCSALCHRFGLTKSNPARLNSKEIPFKLKRFTRISISSYLFLPLAFCFVKSMYFA